MSESASTAVAVPLRAPLRHADYRRLWLAQSISVIGDKLNQISLAMLVFERTGSMLQIGAILAVTVLPAAFLSLPAGALVDRWDRRKTMIASDLLRALFVVLIPFAANWHILAVYALAFASSTAMLFFQPARLSLVPDVVDGDELMAANSLDNASIAVSELLGLAIGGLVVAAVGWRVAFFADGATFVVSALFVASVAYRSVTAPATRQTAGSALRRFVDEIRDGLRALRSSDVLRDLLGIFVLLALAGYSFMTLGHLLALYTYDAGSVGLAIVDGAVTAGILLGSVLVGRSGTRRAGRKFLFGEMGMGAAALLLAFTPTLTVAAPLFLLAGIANMYFLIPMITLIQEKAPPEMRGRALAARVAIGSASGAIGLVGAGAVAELIGVQTTLAITGVVLLAVAAVGWSRRPLREA